MNLVLVVCTPFLGAAASALAARLGRSAAGWTAAAITLIALALLAPSFSPVFRGETQLQRLPWIPDLGLDLALRCDGLSLLFALLILLMGLLIILYARYYLDVSDRMGRFYASLLLFMGSMLGIVLSENLLLLLIFWELTSLSSFLLISYWYQRDEARNGALMSLAITGLGGLALLAGFLLLGQIAGSYDLSDILQQGQRIRTDPLYLPALLLILLGAFTKSAQFPFHFWLPQAMAAPTPVSAYLHSATMVKAGIFLLARLFPVLSGTPEWTWLVIGAGLTTFVFGAWVAVFQHDLKGLLAYSTISHLGLIVLLFGMATPLAAVAGVFHIINHATFKASLFMAAGIIDHECGTRDMRRINGLWHYMPYTATLAMIAAASMAGVPLFNGFLSKEMFFAETASFLNDHPLSWAMPILVVIAGMLAVTYSLRFIHDVFFNGKPVDLPRTPHEPPLWMKAPVAILVAICLLVGIFPEHTVEPILDVAVASVLQAPPPEHNLAIWHGFNAAVVMSLLAMTGGVLIYAARRFLFALATRYPRRLHGRDVFAALLRQDQFTATALTRLIDRDSLPWQLVLFLIMAIALGLFGFLSAHGPWTGDAILKPMDGLGLIISIGLAAGACATVWLHPQRFTALVVIGSVGLLLALLFVQYSAPDLALTQLSVEMVTIVLLLLALYFLPQHTPPEPSPIRRWRDAALALGTGSAVAALTWAIQTRPTPDSISSYFLANSVEKGGGANVVNVILVDFRGFDTLGEISVLALAGLGIYAMLKDLQLPGARIDVAGQSWNWDAHPTIMSALSRVMLPLALLVAVFIFLRGHNLPGGGFIAGLITAVALILQYLTNGVDWMHQRLSNNMHPLIAAGLLVGLLTGTVSLVLGYPFLTSAFTHVHWPVIGDFELASAMFFDLGVSLVVVGATLLILIHLGLMSDSSHAPEAAPQENAP